MRWTRPALLWLLASALAAGKQDPPDPAALHAQAEAKLRKTVATRHVSVGETSASRGMHGWARDEYVRAIRLDPDHEVARKKLGDRRKADGSGWELDPEARIVVLNEKKKDDELARIREEIERKRRDIGRDSSREWAALGDAAEKAGLAKEAAEAWRLAIEYDPDHEATRRKLGHEKGGDGRWITPEEKKLREELVGGLAKAPAGEPDKAASEAGTKLGIAMQRRVSEHFEVESSHLSQDDLGTVIRHAEHAYAMYHKLFAQPKSLFPKRYLMILLKDRPEHQRYIDAFHDGTEADKKFSRDKCGGWGGYPRSECFQSRPDPVLNRDYAVHYTIQALAGGTAGGRQRWFLEGTALWFTARLTKTASWSCVQLGGTTSGETTKHYDNPAKWPDLVKGWLKDGGDPVIDAVIKAPNWAELDGAETVKAWSLVDFLVALHLEKLPALLRSMKAGEQETAEAAFREVFGWSLADLDAAWKAWARGAY